MPIRFFLLCVLFLTVVTNVVTVAPVAAQEEDRFSWNGMIRSRLQGDYQDGSRAVNRFMYGAFLNATLRVSDRIDVTGKVMTGNSKAITVADWMSYGDLFVRESPHISWMYARIRPNPSLTLTAGKFPLPFFRPTQVVLDSDLSPEGLAQQITTKSADGSATFGLNFGQFMINQLASAVKDLDRTYFLGGQAMARFTQPGRSQTLAVAYYTVGGADSLFASQNLRSPALIVAANSNRPNADRTGYLSEFRMINFSGQYTQTVNGRPLALNADYVLNTGADDMRHGITGSVMYGSTGKVGDTRTGFQAFLMQQDATLAPFSNIDYTQTNTRGAALFFGHHLIEKLTVDIHLYTRKYDSPETLVSPVANNAWRTRLRVMFMLRLN
ncbi:MAG: putative porin [Gemmatimonadetes bacterium]|nr:putative porin [Gemmatimonadota bacterium]